MNESTKEVYVESLQSILRKVEHAEIILGKMELELDPVPSGFKLGPKEYLHLKVYGEVSDALKELKEMLGIEDPGD